MTNVPALPRRWAAILATCLVALLLTPATAGAHADLTVSDPADGASVAGPFAGPVTLTFSEALQSGSHAELVDGSGSKIADATVDGARMTFTPAVPLAPGAYRVQWTSVAADKDVARGTFGFIVIEPTPAPATPTLVATEAPTESPTDAPTEAAPSATPAASPAPIPDSTNGADTLVPIAAALVLVLVAGAFLLRRGRAAR